MVIFSSPRLSFDGHLCLENTAGLQVIQQVAPPLVEQIVVERVLLINRHVFFYLAAAQTKSFNRHLDQRARIDIERVIHGVLFRAIAVVDGDLRQQAILLLVLLAQALQGVGQAIGGNRVAVIEVGNFSNFLGRIAWLPSDVDAAHVGLFTNRDLEPNTDLLRLGIRLLGVGNLRVVVPVLFHQTADSEQGAIHFFARKQLAELQLAGIDDLRVGGVGGSTVHGDFADEIIGGGKKDDCDLAIRGALGFHLNASEPARGIKRLYALAEFSAFQGFARLQGDQLLQFSLLLGLD